MRGKTSIRNRGFQISSAVDANLGALDLEGNKNIFFLSNSPNAIYPNLQAYAAWNCAIREISATNFRGLVRLKLLNLSYNQIETVGMDAFEDLKALRELYLRKKNYQPKFN
jgi:hypothetical protein